MKIEWEYNSATGYYDLLDHKYGPFSNELRCLSWISVKTIISINLN